MIFQIGKFYEHSAGMQMAIVGEVLTTMYGNTLIAECSNCGDFRPVGRDESATQNWSEITKGKWLRNFSRENNLPPSFPEKIMTLNTIQPSGHFYPSDLVQKKIDEMKEAGHSLLGVMGIPQYDPNVTYLDLEEVSHEIKNLRIVDDVLLGDIYILNTPKGKVLWDMMLETHVDFKCALLANMPQPAGEINVVSAIHFLGIHAVPREETT